MGQVFGYIRAEDLFDNEDFDKKYDEALIETETMRATANFNNFSSLSLYTKPFRGGLLDTN